MVLTEKQIEEWKVKIDQMSHSEMASLWRFAPSGHPIFDNRYPLFNYFQKRFKDFGGMTTEISKQIGWR